MRPVLTDFFGIPISAFGVFLLLAFFTAATMARRAAKAQLGVDPTATLDLALYAIIAGIIGGRIGYILVNIGFFIQDPARMFTIWRDGGLVFYGALVAALLLARWYAKTWKVSFGALLDAFAPALVVGYGIAMIGALLHGLFAGRPTGVPWAIEMGLERRHPAPVYLLLASAAILGILRAQRGQRLAQGTLFVLVLFLQAVARFVVDFFVEQVPGVGPPIPGPLTVAQWASGIVAVVTAVLLVRLQHQVASEPDVPVEVTAGSPT